MTLVLERKKKKNLLLSVLYKFSAFLPFKSDKKLRLFLDLAWIFSRLAHEETFRSSVFLGDKTKNVFLLNGISKDSSVLDLGCGRGFVMQQIATQTHHILGVDFNKDDIHYLSQNLPHPNIIVINDDIFSYLTKMPDVYFDCVVLSHILEHLEDPKSFLLRLKNISPKFYVEVPDFESNYLNNYREKVGTDLIYSDADHVSEFRREDLESIFTSLGFSITQSEFRGSVMKYWITSPEKFDARQNWSKFH